MLVIGLIAVKFGDVMREPVTTTSCSELSEASAAAAGAVCDQAVGTTALAAAADSAVRTASCNMRLFPISYPFEVNAPSRRIAPNQHWIGAVACGLLRHTSICASVTQVTTMPSCCGG